MISVKTERFYSAHHVLQRIAKDHLLKAQSKEPGWFDSLFISISLSSLAIEAICNAVGEKALDKWCDFESCSPIAKIRLICERLGIDYDGGIEPWGTIIWLSKTRNLISHPKAHHIKYEAIITLEEQQNQSYRNMPKSKLELQITPTNAKKSVEAVDKLVELFCTKLTLDQKFGIVGDMWHSSAKVHTDEN